MQAGLVSKLGTEAHLDWSKSKIAEPTIILPQRLQMRRVWCYAPQIEKVLALIHHETLKALIAKSSDSNYHDAMQTPGKWTIQF